MSGMNAKLIIGVAVLIAIATSATIFAQRHRGKAKVLVDYSRRTDTPRPKGEYYNDASQKMTLYPIPGFARIKSIRLVRGQTRRLKLTIQMRAPLPPASKDRLAVEAYFDTPQLEGPFDTAVIYVRGYAYPSQPPVLAGTAAIVRADDHSVIGPATVAEHGADITLMFDEHSVGASPKMEAVVIRYLPANVKLSKVSGGMDASVADVEILDKNLREKSIGLPVHP
jgi:hypothetical protein